SENIKTELARLNNIVEGFLGFAKPAVASKGPVDITRLVEEIIGFILPEAERQAVQLQAHLDQAIPNVEGDYSQLRQALLNLFINALQAMPDGGVIEVSASVSAAKKIEIVVKDNGCGIAPENISRLFDPYFTTKIHGFGLGLAVVERIVQEHGGTVQVASQPGKGTSFTITLPPSRMSDNVEVLKY